MIGFVHEDTRRRTGLLAIVGLAVVALLAAVIITRGGGGHSKTTTRSPSREKTQVSGKKPAPDATLAGENVSFQEFFGVQLPSSPAGPKDTKAGRASGFDHSPAGAVLAAMHIFARSETPSGPAIFEPTIQEQVIGPDRDKLLANSQRGYSEAATAGTGPNGELAADVQQARANRVGVWAYRTDSYSEVQSALNLLLRQFVPGTSSYAYINFALTVRWADGDWRLVAPLNGEFSSVAQRISEVPPSYVVIGKD